MAVKGKVFAYALALDREGRVALEGNEPMELDPDWTPEHLVLAGLARCSVASLRHYAQQRAIDVDASASVHGRVTRREDGTYGFVEIVVSIDAVLEPEPDDLRELLDKAEWGCFVGASLKPKPAYVWRVNGENAA